MLPVGKGLKLYICNLKRVSETPDPVVQAADPASWA